MLRRAIAPTFAFLAVLAGCSADDGPPTAPQRTPDVPGRLEPVPEPDRARNERLAEWMATALRDPGFRRTVKLSLERSPVREHKLHLQSFLEGNGAVERKRVASLAGIDASLLAQDLASSTALELYFPVPAHREAWQGGPDLLVATAERDGEAPIAFDLDGGRRLLDPDLPPTTPVLMVEPAETDFSPAPGRLMCIDGCDAGSGGGSGPSGSTATGLYLTQTAFTGTFESWFKGSPEFEVHMLGQDGTSDKMISYQCAGEHAGGAYSFDQNGTTWSGNVLLFSDMQLATYKQQHPSTNLRILVLEDDDGACQIKTDSTRTANLLKAVDLAYSSLTAGTDVKLTSLTRAWKAATGLFKLLAAAASWITTPDDLVGNAVEDPMAASGFFGGANWVVRGENNVITGALRLEMR